MLKVKTSRSAKAPTASRRGSLWQTKPLYLSQPKEFTLHVRKELQNTKVSWAYRFDNQGNNEKIEKCPEALVAAHHVTGCIGTGKDLTTGVSASKLGFASIRSSPAHCCFAQLLYALSCNMSGCSTSCQKIVPHL